MLTTNDNDSKYTHVRWACRRGMLELDLILTKFFDEYFTQLSSCKQSAFIELLKEPDQNLFNWLLGSSIPKEGVWQDLVLFIRHVYNENNQACSVE